MKYLSSLIFCCFTFVAFSYAQKTKIDILPEYKKINKAKAHDRPAPFNFDLYFNPSKLSIPQTNLKVGYFFHQNWNIAFGIDHMKYVLEQYQDVKIDGYINEGSIYDNTYNMQEINLARDFLEYEHTDGLNYVSIEINRVDRILKTRFFDINLTEGFSTAALVPRSDVVLLGKTERDIYKVAGYGFGLKAALNLTFFNYFYVQSEAKGGFIHLPNVKTTSSNTDKAQQSFFYFQNNILFGAIFPIIKKEKRLPKVKE